MLVECGAVLIDADAISREVTAPGGTAVALVVRHFGPNAVTAGGAMDRDYMRDLALSDPTVKRQLEAIIHPLVRVESARLSAAAAGGPQHRLHVLQHDAAAV